MNKHYNSHWNVDIAKKTSHKAHTAKYLGSYVKKPPIAAARLADYAGGDVTFTYLDHRSKTYKDLTLNQTEMMLRILSYVPEKHFKMVRYFGFLSNRLRGRLLPLIYKQLGQEVVAAKTFGFAAMMKAFLKVDPFKCIIMFCIGLFLMDSNLSDSYPSRLPRRGAARMTLVFTFCFGGE